MEIKIRGLSKDTLARIDELKKNKSRNQFIVEKLNEIAIAPELNLVADRYEQIIKRSNDVIEKNSRILGRIFEVDENE